ncbi:Outer membrane protein assembly factor BamA [subsurface metagenome]
MHTITNRSALLIIFFSFTSLLAQTESLSVEKIIINGNEAFADTQLKGLLKTEESGLLPFFRSRPFSRRALRYDEITLEAFYASRGYLECQVSDSIVVNPNGNVTIYITIDEGIQFHLGEITVTGNRLFSDEEIQDILGIHEDDPYSPGMINDRVNALRNIYEDRGKFTIDIQQEAVDINEEIKLQFLISEGSTYTIGQIFLEGIETVPEKYLWRELLFKPGDLYNRTKLVKSHQRIYESGLFRSVEIIPARRSEQDDIADITIRIRELERRSLDLTFDFRQEPSPAEGGEPNTALAAAGQWWHSRVLNTSIRSGITLETSLTLEDLSSPNYSAAWDFLMPWSFGIRVPSTIKFFSDYRTVKNLVWRNGVELSFHSRERRRYHLRGGIAWFFVKGDLVVLDTVQTEGLERRIELDYLFQGVDYIPAPKKGTIIQVTPSFHGTFIKDAPYYYKIELDIRRYHPVGARGVLAYRAKGSYLDVLPGGAKDKLTRLHLFDLGGSTSLRGWSGGGDFWEAGGVIKGLVNLELRMPLFWILGAELFFDAGLLKGLDDVETSGFSWVSGWDGGIGLLISTPLGPIRFDMALPLSGAMADKPVTHVAFLYTF